MYYQSAAVSQVDQMSSQLIKLFNPLTRRVLHAQILCYKRVHYIRFTPPKHQQRYFFQQSRKQQILVDQPLKEDDLKPLPSMLFLLPFGLIVVIYVLVNLGFTGFVLIGC